MFCSILINILTTPLLIMTIQIKLKARIKILSLQVQHTNLLKQFKLSYQHVCLNLLPTIFDNLKKKHVCLNKSDVSFSSKSEQSSSTCTTKRDLMTNDSQLDQSRYGSIDHCFGCA